MKIARSDTRRPTAIDLFCGCGGLSVGLAQAGFKVVGAVEFDARAARIYRLNHSTVKLWETDIRRLSGEAILKDLRMKKGELDVLAGCPPCQGFSTLRTNNGSVLNRDRRNDLVREMLRLVRTIRPKAVLLENVPGLAERQQFKRLVVGLKKLGFSPKWDVLDARHFGVPQRRRRLILIAGRGVTIDLAGKSPKEMTVRDAIKHLPSPGTSNDWLHNLPENRSAKVRELISSIPRDGGSRDDAPERFKLECHKRCDGFKDVYGRMAWDKPSPTITGGCFNPSKGRFLHPQENRAISLREAALLQTFPKRYRFDRSDSKQAIALMIGNAFPPAFIRPHAKKIREAIQGGHELQRDPS